MSDAVWPTPWAYGHGLGRMVFNVGREFVKHGHAVTLLGAEGSALDGAHVIGFPGGGLGAEPTMAGWVRAHAAQFDAFVDTSHTHALASAGTELPGLAWFADAESLPAACAVFVSAWAQARIGLPGVVVHNGIEPDEFPLYEGPRAGLLWMALNVPNKGQGTARVVAQLAGMALACHGPRTEAGPLTGAEKLRALQQSAVYLFPSTNDAGPLTPLEAMACGTPVVALNRTGVAECIVDGANGYLCENARAMAEALPAAMALEPAAIRQSVIDGGFTVERQGAEMAALLERVVEGERW